MLIKINGHLKSVSPRIHSFTKVANGRFVVETSHGSYTVEGGKALGGNADEWFVAGPQYKGRAKGVADAVKLIDSI